MYIYRYMAESEFQLLLPYHRSESIEIDGLVKDLVTYVQALPNRHDDDGNFVCASISSAHLNLVSNRNISCIGGMKSSLFQSPPSAVTIARSAVDGFTPDDQSNYIFDSVVRVIHEELVPFWSKLTGKSVTFKLHDLCVDDVCREAFQLYLNPLAKNAII